MASDQDKPAALLSYVDEMVEKLRTLAPKAICDGDESAIHHARVATRRLKAAVDVLKPLTSKSHRREFTSILSKLRKNLGPARDMDVMLGHLAQVKSYRHKTGAEWLATQLKQKQMEFKKSVGDEVDIARVMSRLGAWWGVRQEWAESIDRVDACIGQSLHRQLNEFIEHANATAVLTGHPPTGVMMDPHELRIAGKALRYTLELAVGGGHRLPVRVTRSFKRMQDALGLWHDHVVLSDWVLKLCVKSGVSLHDSRAAQSVLDVARLSIGKAERHLKAFSRLWAERGEQLSATIRQAFPLPAIEQPASESKADHDPSDSAPLEPQPPVLAASGPSAA